MRVITTILYKDGIMIGDAQVTSGDISVHRTQKVFKLDSGAIVGMSGQLNHCQQFIRHLHNPSEYQLPPMKEVYALVVWPKYPRIIHEFFGDHLPNYMTNNIAATGSGGKLGLLLMQSGMTAIEAIKVIAKSDVNTCPPFHWESIYQRRRKKFDFLLGHHYSPHTIDPPPTRGGDDDEEDDDDMPSIRPHHI